MGGIEKRFEVVVGDKPHVVVVRHSGIIVEKTTIEVDGALVDAKKNRKAFSYLYRYLFAIDGTPVEARLHHASGTPEISLAVGEEIASPVRHTAGGKAAFVGAAVFGLFVALRMVLGGGGAPLAVRGAIAGIALVVTAAIGLVVYRRSATDPG